MAEAVGATERVPKPSRYRIDRAEASVNSGFVGVSGFIARELSPGLSRAIGVAAE
jgi:hypothetical protein